MTPIERAYVIENTVIPRKIYPPTLLFEVRVPRATKSSFEFGRRNVNNTPEVCNKVDKIVSFIKPAKSPDTIVSLETSQIPSIKVLIALDKIPAALDTVVNMA